MSSSLQEGLDEARVLGHVRDDAQLDLRVVGGEQHRVRADVAGDEGAADLLAELGADGDVHGGSGCWRRGGRWRRRSG